MGCCVVIGGGQGCRAQAASLRAPRYPLPEAAALASPQGPSSRFQSWTKPRAFLISMLFICQCTEACLAWANQGDDVWAKSRVLWPLVGPGVCMGLHGATLMLHDATP